MTPEQFLQGDPAAQRLFDAVAGLIRGIGPAEVSVSKSQIAFRRRRAFALVWRPAQYLHGDVAPLVLSIALKSEQASPRWKEVVAPAPGHVMHHLELWQVADIDAEVAAWLQQAWDQSG